MQEADREAFDAILAEIFAGLDKPFGDIQKATFWKGLAKMSLSEMARTRDLLLDEWTREKPPRTFGVPDLWAAKRRLRAPAPEPMKPVADGWRGDDWGQKANSRLLSFVLTQGKVRRYFDAGQTRVLVAFKNRWAQVMRDSGTPEEVSLPDQDAAWRLTIQLVETELSRMSAA